jgi:hypothetical protein
MVGAAVADLDAVVNLDGWCSAHGAAPVVAFEDPGADLPPLPG